MHRIPASLMTYDIATLYGMQDKIQNDMMPAGSFGLIYPIRSLVKSMTRILLNAMNAFLKSSKKTTTGMK